MSSRRNTTKVVVLRERSLAAQQPPTNNQQSKKKTQSKKRVRTRKNRVRANRTLMRSNTQPLFRPCSVDYLHAICDPFQYRLGGKEVCIPDIWDLPSYKFSTRIRGTFHTSATSGTGAVMLAPFTFSNDQACVLFTTTAYLQSGLFPAVDFPSVTGTSYQTDEQFPYDSDNLREVRLVACGLRVRYIGTNLNLGGLVFPLSCNGLNDSLAELSATELMSRPNVVQYPSTRGWQGCTFRPTHPHQMTYAHDSFPLVTVDTPHPSDAKMGVLVQSAATSQPYEYEIVRFFEAISHSGIDEHSSVQSTTPSDSDITGLSNIRQFLGSISDSEVGQTLWSKGSRFVANMLTQGAMAYTGIPLLTNSALPSVIEL